MAEYSTPLLGPIPLRNIQRSEQALGMSRLKNQLSVLASTPCGKPRSEWAPGMFFEPTLEPPLGSIDEFGN